MTLTMTHRVENRKLEREEIWPLFDGFFDTEMHRQTPIPGAKEALARIGQEADVVILTNLHDDYHVSRVEQLDSHGIRHPVRCNQGGKGGPVAALLDQYRPSSAVFVDDLWVHHESVQRHAPGVWRLHMVGEPKIAARVPPAPAAHARIDRWDEAGTWVLARFAEGFAPMEAA